MKKYLLLLAGVIAIICFHSGSQKAAAATGPFDRDFDTAYFTGDKVPGTNWAFVPWPDVPYQGLGPGCITSCTVTLDSFIKTYHDRLWDSSSYVDSGRAAAEIDMMLDKPGTQFGDIDTGITYAKDHFYSTWVPLIQLYASGTVPGYSVQWNASVYFDVNFNINGLGAQNNAAFGGTTCDPVDQCIADMTFHNGFVDNHFDDAVVFTYPGGSFYIKHKCANFTGDHVGLPTPTFSPPTCGSTATSATIDPSTQFTIAAAIDFYDSGGANSAYYYGDQISIQVQGPDPTNTFNYGPTVIRPPPPADNSLTATTGTIGPVGATGTYTITYNLLDSSGSVILRCSNNFKVVNMPFFRVDGGDVSAGASMGVGGVNCATTADQYAGVVSWNKENAAYNGAGTQYAAFALNYLQDFATSQGTASQAPKGLSFSNTKNVNISGNGTDTYGGAYGSETCAPDYFSNHPTVATFNSFHTFNNASDIGKTFYMTGTLNISAYIPVPNGTHTTIYVDGDVVIGSSIRYTNNYPGGVVDIPSFTIIARGNIFVSKWADHLDGWFIAEPTTATSNDGIFYTCSYTWHTAPALDSQLQNNCDNSTLSVNGAVTARQVWMTRTLGTLNANTPSETFTLVPEVWLGSPFSNSSASGASYDSITSLPPSL